MDLIHHSQVEKVSKLLERGFDPNYHDSESGGKAPAEQKKSSFPVGPSITLLEVKYFQGQHPPSL